MMTVLVTGASGYIGRHLVSSLRKQGVGCVPLARAEGAGRFRDLTTRLEGSLDSFLAAGISHVVHLAGRLVERREDGIAAYFKPNVRLTDELAAACVEHGVEVLIHASSRLVYPATLTAPAVEDVDDCPDTPYGLSKRWAEDVVRYRTHGTRTSAISLRIAQVTGGDHPGLGVINRFIKQAVDESVITVSGAGTAVRDIVHVDDVAEAVRAALSYRGSWCPVNIGGVEPVTIAELAREVAVQAGLDERAVRHLSVSEEDSSNYGLDARRRRATLAWEPRATCADIITEALKQEEFNEDR